MSMRQEWHVVLTEFQKSIFKKDITDQFFNSVHSLNGTLNIKRRMTALACKLAAMRKRVSQCIGVAQ